MIKRTVLLLIILSFVLSAYSVYAESYDVIEGIFQKKHIEVCTSISSNEDIIKLDDNTDKIYGSMIRTQGRDTLWDGLDLKLSSSNHYGFHDAFSKLMSLAKALKCPGSKYYNNTQLKADIISALEFLKERGYNENTPIKEAAKGNWYYWEISIPQSVVSLMFYMRDDLPHNLYEEYITALKHFIQSPDIAGAGAIAATGANLAWKCSLWIKIGVINNDENMITDGIKYMNPLFKYAEDLHSNDGFYKDGSFIQHENIAYNGGYGSSHVSEVLNVVEFLDKTKYAFPDDKVEILVDWIKYGFMPLIYNGNMMDMVRGREIARQNTTDLSRGVSNLYLCFRVAQIAPDSQKKEILSFVKNQLKNNPSASEKFISGLSDKRKKQFEEMMNNSDYSYSSDTRAKIYNKMSRAVYSGENFSLGIAMYSDRIKTHEFLASENENKKSWFVSHGATYLYTNDVTQYSRDFYPTVDPYMISGITRADTERKFNESGLTNKSAFAGGTSLDGKYAVIGFHMFDWPDKNSESLEAKKSYFCFDNRIVALGLVNTNSVPAKTVIENRIVQNGEKILYDKKEILAGKNENSVSDYVYLGGNNNVGYVLGKGTRATLKTESRNGAWSDISDKSYNSKEIKTNEYITVYTDHEEKKNNQTYEYVILPSASRNFVENFNSDDEYKVIENSENAAAIISLKNNMEMVNFYSDDKYSAGCITAEQPCSVIVKEADGKLSISAADPTCKADKLKITVNKSVGSLIYKSDEIIKTEIGKDSVYIEINLSVNHIGIFEAMFESDTGFKTYFDSADSDELALQDVTVIKGDSSYMLYEGNKISIYPENNNIKTINRDGILYIPLRTFALIYNSEISTDTDNIYAMHNNKMIIFSSDGKISSDDSEEQSHYWFKYNGIVYVPMRYIAGSLYGVQTEYKSPFAVIGAKSALSEVNESAIELACNKFKN